MLQKDRVGDAVRHRLARIDHLRQRVAAWKGTEDVEMIQEKALSSKALDSSTSTGELVSLLSPKP